MRNQKKVSTKILHPYDWFLMLVEMSSGTFEQIFESLYWVKFFLQMHIRIVPLRVLKI